MSTFFVMKISLLVIRCQDLEASKVFYQQLGLVFEKEQHGSGPIHYSCEYDVVVDPDGRKIELKES